MELTKVAYTSFGTPAGAPVTALTPVQRAEQQQMIQAVEAVNKAELFGENYELMFAYDRNRHRPVLRLVDKQTKEVIRQIPPEYLLRLAEDLSRP